MIKAGSSKLKKHKLFTTIAENNKILIGYYGKLGTFGSSGSDGMEI